MSATFFTPLLLEALGASGPADPAQGVVAIRVAGVVYVGHIVNVQDDGSGATMACVDRYGHSAPYPVHISVAAIEAMRYADLHESPDASFTAGGGPV